MNRTKNKFDITKKIISSYIIRKKSFTLESISKEIIDKGGLLRISPGLTVKECLEELTDNKILIYNIPKQSYKTNKAY